jgi:hypothetical protein
VTFETSETAARPAGDEFSASALYADAPPGAEVFDVREEDAVAGVLRWLLMETEADAAAYLRLGPGGVEQLRVEPRGLDPTGVAGLAGRAHEALMLTGREEHVTTDAATTRWLGVGGSKVLVLEGIPRRCGSPVSPSSGWPPRAAVPASPSWSGGFERFLGSCGRRSPRVSRLTSG